MIIHVYKNTCTYVYMFLCIQFDTIIFDQILCDTIIFDKILLALNG